jgi:hypothetical protein
MTFPVSSARATARATVSACQRPGAMGQKRRAAPLEDLGDAHLHDVLPVNRPMHRQAPPRRHGRPRFRARASSPRTVLQHGPVARATLRLRQSGGTGAAGLPGAGSSVTASCHVRVDIALRRSRLRACSAVPRHPSGACSSPLFARDQDQGRGQQERRGDRPARDRFVRKGRRSDSAAMADTAGRLCGAPCTLQSGAPASSKRGQHPHAGKVVAFEDPRGKPRLFRHAPVASRPAHRLGRRGPDLRQGALDTSGHSAALRAVRSSAMVQPCILRRVMKLIGIGRAAIHGDAQPAVRTRVEIRRPEEGELAAEHVDGPHVGGQKVVADFPVGRLRLRPAPGARSGGARAGT